MKRSCNTRLLSIILFTLGILAVAADMAAAQCLAPNRWAWGSCGGRGGGGGGGGPNRAAAAAGAASAAIGAFAILIEQAEAAERANQNAANEGARRRAAFCNAKYKHSYALNEEARATMSSDPEGAFEKFEEALTNLGNCGMRADLAKLRANLDTARTSYAALMRPSESKNLYGGDAPSRPNATAQQLMARARAQCTHLEEGTGGWSLCIRRQLANAIFYADRDARQVCQGVANEDLRLQCALNQYFAGLYGKDPKQFGDPSHCYWDEQGRPCQGRSAAVPASSGTAKIGGPRGETFPEETEFQKELRKKIEAMPDTVSQSTVDQARDAEIARAKAVAAGLPPGSPARKQLEDVIAKAEADRAAEAEGGNTPKADEHKQAAADPAEAKKQADEPYEYGEDANRRRGAAKKKRQEDEAVSNYSQSGSHASQGGNSGALDMKNPGAGVPNNGSFGNDFGGDKLLDEPIPSNR